MATSRKPDSERVDEEECFEEMAQRFHARARRLLPPEFRRHMIAARREFLLGVRSLIDARIEQLDEQERATGKKATKVSVE